MNQDKEENIIKKVLTTEVKYVLGLLVFGFGVVTPYFSMKENIALIQKDISIINNNHEVHIQDIMVELKKIKEDEVGLEKDLTRTNQILIDHIK